MQFNLSENIKKNRKDMKLTQEELAEAFGVTVGAVSKWESGSTVPDILTLMQLADFFSISVDALLGYSMSSKNIDDILKRIIALLKEGKYDDAVSEADKALVRYPGNFRVITECADAINVAAAVKSDEVLRNRAIELYESSLKYISQNTDSDRNEFDIKFQIAQLKSRINPEESLKVFNEINYFGVVDASIANLYMIMGKTEEALDRYTRVLTLVLIESYKFSTGMFLTLVETDTDKSYDEATKLMDWSLNFLENTETTKISYITIMKIRALIFKSLALSCRKDYENMKACVDTALKLAREYDKNPANDFTNKIKFWHGKEDLNPSYYDELGVAAVTGIDNLFKEGPIYLSDKIIKKMQPALDYWSSLKAV